MGKPDRKLKRKHAQASQSSLTRQSVLELQKLPGILESMIDANKKLTDENARIQEAVGEILEEHANKISALEKKVLNLELNSGDAANPGIVNIEGDGDEKPIHSSVT